MIININFKHLYCCFWCFGSFVIYVSHIVRKPVFGVSKQVQAQTRPQKIARGLKFQILQVEELHYLCSKNKDNDQLRGYCAADLCLLFLHMQKAGLYMTKLNYCSCVISLDSLLFLVFITYEQSHEKSCLWGFQPDPTKTRL